MSTSDSGIIVLGFSNIGRNHFRKMKNHWSKPKRKEGEYPFLPKPAEHPVLHPVHFMTVLDQDTYQPRQVIDYSNGIQATTGFLQCGEGF